MGFFFNVKRNLFIKEKCNSTRSIKRIIIPMQPSIKLLFKKSDFLESNNLFKITICVLMRLIIHMLVAFKRLTQKVVLIV